MRKGTVEKASVGIASKVHGISGGGAGDGGSVTQHSTDVLPNVVIKPVFWGSQWFQPSTPSAGQILWAIRSILFGPYMSGLAQYGVGNGVLDPNPVFTGFNPDPPQNFTTTDIETMLTNLLESHQIGDQGANTQQLLTFA